MKRINFKNWVSAVFDVYCAGVYSLASWIFDKMVWFYTNKPKSAIVVTIVLILSEALFFDIRASIERTDNSYVCDSLSYQIDSLSNTDRYEAGYAKGLVDGNNKAFE